LHIFKNDLNFRANFWGFFYKQHKKPSFNVLKTRAIAWYIKRPHTELQKFSSKLPKISIQNKDVLLTDICDDVRPDFFAITETRLTFEHGDSVLMKSCPGGYTALQRPWTSAQKVAVLLSWALTLSCVAVYLILAIHLSSISIFFSLFGPDLLCDL
jgi:hypothetical protein